MKTELDYLIEFWRNFSRHNKCFLSLSMETLIKQTIDYLEKLKEIEPQKGGKLPGW